MKNPARGFSLLTSLTLFAANTVSAMDFVTCYSNQTFVQFTGQWIPLTSDLALPGDITVFTNGTFQIKDGKVRELGEAQVLRGDGHLLNPDGSSLPVFDHIVMKGRVLVFKDGESQTLSGPLTLADGSVIQPDGFYTRPNGRRSRLVDGQLLTPDGGVLSGLDTIGLYNGMVVVYKVGALIPLFPQNKIMGMYDGTKVTGTGIVVTMGGNATQLTEGQMITVAGLRAGW
jgi:hypothetical protein